MDSGACRATVLRVSELDMTERLSTHTGELRSYKPDHTTKKTKKTAALCSPSPWLPWPQGSSPGALTWRRYLLQNVYYHALGFLSTVFSFVPVLGLLYKVQAQ